MRIVIVQVSIHHHNTAKISEAMAAAIGAQMMSITEAANSPAESWDLLGLGSGIFFGAHHKSLLRFASQLQNPPAASFLYSTAGLPSLGWLWHRSLRQIMARKSIPVLGEACFAGWDTVGPLRWIGGVQRGRPNQHDLDRAARFAKHVVSRMQDFRPDHPTESSERANVSQLTN